MRWLISYDIVDDKSRARVAKILEAWGDRMQYSVFECELTSPELKALQTELNEFIEPTEDSLRYYPICTTCLNNSHHSGRAMRPGASRSFYLC